jgi:hypothetical protein
VQDIDVLTKCRMTAGAVANACPLGRIASARPRHGALGRLFGLGVQPAVAKPSEAEYGPKMQPRG